MSAVLSLCANRLGLCRLHANSNPALYSANLTADSVTVMCICVSTLGNDFIQCSLSHSANLTADSVTVMCIHVRK